MQTDFLTQLDPGTATRVMDGALGSQSYDLQASTRDLGLGENLFVNFLAQIGVAGDPGLKVELQVLALPFDPAGRKTATVTFDFTGGAAEDICLWTAHGLNVGDPFRFTGGTPPTGLEASHTYYVIPLNANAFQVASTRENAFDGVEVEFTSDGSGTITGTGFATGFGSTVTADFTGGTVEDMINWTAHGLTVGCAVRLTTGDSGVIPTGLVEDETYFVTNPSTDYFQLAASYEDALAGTVKEFTSDSTATVYCEFMPTVVGTSGKIPKELLLIGAVVPVRVGPIHIMAGGGDAWLKSHTDRWLVTRILQSTPSGGLVSVTSCTFRDELIHGHQDGATFYASGFTLA